MKISGQADTKRESSNIFLIFLMWILIPLLFAGAVFLLLAQFANINVVDKAKEVTGQLPFLSEQKIDENPMDKGNLEKIVTLQAEIQDREAQIHQLEKDLKEVDGENEKLRIEQERLLHEIETLKREREANAKKFKEIVTTFEQMSAKSAAPVIASMSDAEAIRILANLKPDTLASVLERMTPEQAAKYTEMMAK